jgi:hypothetical protein
MLASLWNHLLHGACATLIKTRKGKA